MHAGGQRVLVDLDERPVAARYFGRGQINADPSRCASLALPTCCCTQERSFSPRTELDRDRLVLQTLVTTKQIPAH